LKLVIDAANVLGHGLHTVPQSAAAKIKHTVPNAHKAMIVLVLTSPSIPI
jgi:hypothetical protein